MKLCVMMMTIESVKSNKSQYMKQFTLCFEITLEASECPSFFYMLLYMYRVCVELFYICGVMTVIGVS